MFGRMAPRGRRTSGVEGACRVGCLRGRAVARRSGARVARGGVCFGENHSGRGSGVPALGGWEEWQ